MAVVRLIEWPSEPMSNTAIVPLLDNVYKTCRLPSTTIWEIASSSANAALKNEGKIYDSVPTEWLTFRHLLLNQPPSAWSRTRKEYVQLLAQVMLPNYHRVEKKVT